MNMCRPVTVIIPAFNVAPWLPMLFSGLDAQTFRDFETIFIDDGSTDGTAALLDAYAASREGVKVLHQPNGGVSRARNKGIEHASGDYVVFIDADDTVAPSYLADLFSLATSLDLDIAMCCGWRFYEKPGDMEEHVLLCLPKPQGVVSGPEWLKTTLHSGEMFGYVYMTMVRRDLIKRHAIRFQEDACMGEDFLWAAMIQSKAGRVSYIPKGSYYYRETPGSILRDSSIRGKFCRIESCMVIIEELWGIVDTQPLEIAKLFRKLAAIQSRGLLQRVAEVGSLPLRIAISARLRKRGFLARFFRDAEIFWHWKRIFIAYGFSWLGISAGGNDPSAGSADRLIPQISDDLP